jgi:hypothetical protein
MFLVLGHIWIAAARVREIERDVNQLASEKLLVWETVWEICATLVAGQVATIKLRRYPISRSTGLNNRREDDVIVSATR